MSTVQRFASIVAMMLAVLAMSAAVASASLRVSSFEGGVECQLAQSEGELGSSCAVTLTSDDFVFGMSTAQFESAFAKCSLDLLLLPDYNGEFWISEGSAYSENNPWCKIRHSPEGLPWHGHFEAAGGGYVAKIDKVDFYRESAAVWQGVPMSLYLSAGETSPWSTGGRQVLTYNTAAPPANFAASWVEGELTPDIPLYFEETEDY
jgi:hypothetical protein